jgi:hypothetical protein
MSSAGKNARRDLSELTAVSQMKRRNLMIFVKEKLTAATTKRLMNFGKAH